MIFKLIILKKDDVVVVSNDDKNESLDVRSSRSSSSCSSQATVIRVKKKLNEAAIHNNATHKKKSIECENSLKNKLLREKQRLLKALLKEKQILNEETKRQRQLKASKCVTNESYFSDNFDFERSKQRLHKYMHTLHPYELNDETTTTTTTTMNNTSSCTDLTHHDSDSFNSLSHLSKRFVSSQCLTRMNQKCLRGEKERRDFCLSKPSLQHGLVKAHSCKNIYKKGGFLFV